MNKVGFSLMECMAYCIIVAIIMMLWFNAVASFTRLCTTQACQINSLTTAYSALDVFTRDIRKAPREQYLWPLITDTAFVFKLPDFFIGWECREGQLIRYQGNYNSVNKQWIKKTKSLVLDTIDACSFSLKYFHKDIVSIKITFMAYGKTLSRTSYVI